ncbi:MAG TPA: TolC family protein, partial [Opitutus sp.]|nr:TolC family protein [Opitutus sp.]
MSSSPLYFTSRYTFGLAIALAAAAASGQEIVLPSLSLSEALQRAESSNPSLVAQSFDERAAEALIEQANVRPGPTLDVTLENFAGTGTVGGIDRLESTVQANQTFERGGKREKRVALATRDHETAAQTSAVRRAEIRAQAATAYVALVAAQERLALATELLELARQALTLVNARVSAGAASSVEAARARAAVAVAQSDHNRAASTILFARSALAATWGGNASDVATVDGELRLPDEIPVESSFRARLATHPRLKMQSAIIAGRRAALTLEQAQAAQDVTAGGGVRFLREGSEVALVAAVSV